MKTSLILTGNVFVSDTETPSTMSATRSSQIFHRCQEPERLIEGDLTCGISSITLAVSGNEVEIEYGSAVFSSGLRTGYDEAVRFKVEFLRPRKLNRCYTGDQHATARMACYQSSWLAYKSRERYTYYISYHTDR